MAQYSTCGLVGSIAKSLKFSAVVIEAVVLLHLMPPSVLFHTPRFPANPLGGNPPTVAYTTFLSVGSTTILEMERRSKMLLPRSVQLPPPSEDLRMPRP